MNGSATVMNRFNIITTVFSARCENEKLLLLSYLPMKNKLRMLSTKSPSAHIGNAIMYVGHMYKC